MNGQESVQKGILEEKVESGADTSITEVQETKKPMSIRKKGLIALLAVSTFFGTFQSIDTEQLEKARKKEIVTIVYNRKGTSAGITAGSINEVYGNSIGIPVGLFNIIYGNFYGIAIGAASNCVSYEANGVLLGFGNFINGKFTGLEASILNSSTDENGRIHEGRTIVDKGLQLALICNNAGKLKNGIQIGALNYAKEVEGLYLQLGLWNEASNKNSIGINVGYNTGDKNKK